MSADKTKTYCIYDGPDEAAIRRVAEKNNLPVDSVVPVTVLTPTCTIERGASDVRA